MYKLHRETFYLAQDFFDRYMASQHDIVKTLLQLVGISALFIAAKLEVRAGPGARAAARAGLLLPRAPPRSGRGPLCTPHTPHLPREAPSADAHTDPGHEREAGRA